MKIGFFGLLTLLLVALKLMGYISISWLLIMLTPFIGFGIFLIFVFALITLQTFLER